jgi:poly-gamma-glutamate capsule biosynthesis protein CapA/YwtB (metallophosphatase superfamily)
VLKQLRKMLFVLCISCLFHHFIRAQSPQEPVARCTVLVVGDIMVHDKQLRSAWNETTKTYDFNPCFQFIRERLSAADLTIGNLETTLPGENYTGYPCFGSPDALIGALKQAGFDLLTTANNHVCDRGAKGLRRTLDVLDRYQIAHCGSYRNPDEAGNSVLVITKNGFRMAFLNYTYGTNGIPVPKNTVVHLLDSTLIAAHMQTAITLNPDVIIALLHYGKEYTRSPSREQKNWVNFLLEQGADIVLGGHPHVVQPFELKKVRDRYGRIRPRLVMYSMGNFISHQKTANTDTGILFTFTLVKSIGVKRRPVINFEEIGYTPIMVYEEKKPHRHTHYLLPVEDFVHGGPLRVPETIQKKCRRTETDFRMQLAESMRQVNAFLRAESRRSSGTAVY